MSISRDAVVDYDEIVDHDAEPLGPIHPGEVLREEFLDPLGISTYALAKAISVPRNRVTAIVRGERAVTADTALRLARYFGTTERFWMNLQTRYDLEVEKGRLKGRLSGFSERATQGQP